MELQMNARLLPLAPQQSAIRGPRLRFGMPLLTLVSMPWLEMGFFAVMIVTVIRLGT